MIRREPLMTTQMPTMRPDSFADRHRTLRTLAPSHVRTETRDRSTPPAGGISLAAALGATLLNVTGASLR